MVHLANATLWLALWLLAMRAAAGVIDSPECRRDLAVADQLIHAVQLRETAFSQAISSVCAGCYGRTCKI
jgi:hypothetical protein